MRLQVSFYLLNKLCFPVIRTAFPAFEAFQGRLTKNLQEMNNPGAQTPRPQQRAGTEAAPGGAGLQGRGGDSGDAAGGPHACPTETPPAPSGVPWGLGNPVKGALGLCSPPAPGCHPLPTPGRGGVPHGPTSASSRRWDPSGTAPLAPYWSARG